MRYQPRPDCQIPVLADLYEAHLPGVTGRFVEVGASDGASVSNTVFLAEAGWTGLYVEPHPVSYALCVKNHAQHPNVSTANVAISSFTGEADLFDIGDCSSLIWDKNAKDWGGNQSKKFKVNVMTLDQLLEAVHWEPGFELLVIDVEQNELNVLAGFTIRHWKPQVVIIEAHEQDAAPERNGKAPGINAYFARNGYRKVYADHINTMFVR